jgi:signal transduction histidine kinase
VLTADGIYGQHEKSDWCHIGKEEGLSNNDVRDLIFDSEGSIWAATYRGGLNHLMKTPFKTFSANEGLHAEAIGAFEQLTDTKYMVGTTEGKLFVIENDVVRPFQIKTPIKQRIYDLLYDHKKNLWVVSYEGLLLITPDGREKLFTEKDGLSTNQIRIIYQDQKNNYLIGTRTHGLLQMGFDEFPFRPDFQKYKYDELTHLNSTFIMSIEEDRKGNLLIGSNTGGLNILSADGTIQNYSKNKGLISNVTYSVRADRENVLWIATSEGLCKLENDQLINYSKKDGLPIESVFDAVEDNQGYLWMPTAKGIVRVQKKQLKEYTEKKIDKIDWKVFNNKDELERSECTGATHMAVGKDSSLWFMMLRGIVNVNPAQVIRNERKPSVYIEKVTVDDKDLDLEIRDNIVIAPEHQRIAFNYIGISLLYPRTVKYKYKLENFDRDWIDAGTELQAIYTNLRHGTYTFSVIACNNDGVWSSAGSTVSFVVNPYYYETWWFYLLIGAAFATGLFGYVRWRTRELKRESVMLEQKIDERTKLIAEQRDEMAVLYEELRANQEEIMAQRDDLAEKNEEIASINTNLESIVAERTRSLEDQNKRLSEYAFINAHQLRAPLASILGLINLFKTDTPMQEQHELLELLKKSSVELDQIVRSISRMLEGMEGSKDKEKEKELP